MNEQEKAALRAAAQAELSAALQELAAAESALQTLAPYDPVRRRQVPPDVHGAPIPSPSQGPTWVEAAVRERELLRRFDEGDPHLVEDPRSTLDDDRRLVIAFRATSLPALRARWAAARARVDAAEFAVRKWSLA